MQSNNEKLSAQQSLELITAMIRQAKGNVSSNSFHLLLWGWTLVIANVGVYLLMSFTDFKHPYIVFSITGVSAIISIVYGTRQSKRATAKTILDMANMWIWVCYMILCFTVIAFGSKINWQINPLLITMASVPTFVTGVMLRFRPLMFGGITLWLFGIALFVVPRDIQFLVAAIAIAVGYLIPGYKLSKSDV